MINYRFAQLQDAESIAALHTQSWKQAYRGILRDDYLDGTIGEDRLSVWQGRLTNPAPNQRILLAEENGQLGGFICLYLDNDPQLGTLIDNLHVTPALKGRGIGFGLMREAARQVIPQATQRGFHLLVYEANKPAIQFYERVGGRMVGSDIHEAPGGGRAAFLWYAWPSVNDLPERTQGMPAHRQ